MRIQFIYIFKLQKKMLTSAINEWVTCYLQKWGLIRSCIWIIIDMNIYVNYTHHSCGLC